MNHDYYETLQVHPKADQEAIQAAYARLRALYDPVRLEGAADELLELARRKRDDIERAYAVLSDLERRAAYDEQALLAEEQDADDDGEVLDYRPLPPARRSERAKGYDDRTVRVQGRAAPAPRVQPAVAVAGALLAVAVIGAIVFVLIGQSPGALVSAQPTVVPTESPLNQFEAELTSAKTAAEQTPPNADALINYANLAYNSVEIVRENQPDSQLYKDRVPRWLEATQAYSQALALQPNNYEVLADYGVSSCFYGASTGDASYADNGLVAVKQAAEQLADNPRVLLSLGHCLVSVKPPRTPEALEAWLKIRESQPETSAFAQQAQELIDKYQK